MYDEGIKRAFEKIAEEMIDFCGRSSQKDMGEAELDLEGFISRLESENAFLSAVRNVSFGPFGGSARDLRFDCLLDLGEGVERSCVLMTLHSMTEGIRVTGAIRYGSRFYNSLVPADYCKK